MKFAIKFVAFVVALNVVRYLVGGTIESFTIMEPMHRMIPDFPGVFVVDFSGPDFARSFFYNFMLWFAAALTFHLMHPALTGSWMVKSFKAYGVACLSFISLALVYGNHFDYPVRAFFMWSAIDAVIVFTVVATANALLYPRMFKSELEN